MMDTFWLRGNIDQSSVRGTSLLRKPAFSPQISFSGVTDEAPINSQDIIQEILMHQDSKKVMIKCQFLCTVKI